MMNAALGNKQQCPKCGAKFYDFHQTPVACPKCKHSWVIKVAKPPKVKEAKPLKPVIKKKPKASEDDVAFDDVIPEIEEIDNDVGDIEALEEIEEHQEVEDVDPNGDDAEDEMYMQGHAEGALVDEVEEDQADEEESDDDDDRPTPKKRR
jgi:uncharacterized protein (TIGR02300 family)